MNKQPFYHRVDGLLFTTITGMPEAEFLRRLKNWAKELGMLADSIEIEPNGYGEPEPGDPADLL